MLPKHLPILEIVCSGALLVLPTIILLSHNSAALAAFLIVISLPRTSSIVAYVTCKITYNKDGMILVFIHKGLIPFYRAEGTSGTAGDRLRDFLYPNNAHKAMLLRPIGR